MSDGGWQWMVGGGESGIKVPGVTGPPLARPSSAREPVRNAWGRHEVGGDTAAMR